LNMLQPSSGAAANASAITPASARSLQVDLSDPRNDAIMSAI